MDDATAMLAERVGRLERSARRWRGLAVGAGAGLVGLALAGAARVADGPVKALRVDHLTVDRVSVVDSRGRERIDINSAVGHPRIFLYNEDGKLDASLQSGLNSGTLTVGSEGTMKARIGVDETGVARFVSLGNETTPQRAFPPKP